MDTKILSSGQVPLQGEILVHIPPDQQGLYFPQPFTMPPDTESLTLSYSYERHRDIDIPGEGGVFTARQEVNIVDLGLIAPDGRLVGASGSDKRQITVSETAATPGYDPTLLIPGEWHIIVGAYKIAPEGVDVRYQLAFTPKTRRLLKGDLHAHTLASDGVLTAEELGWRAMRHGLDFVAITDHNHMVSADALPSIPGLTILPGVEWTHYRGHANMLGVYQPYDGAFTANTEEDVLRLFTTARERGALITLNHPFEVPYSFQFSMQSIPFDCLEIWNGPMREPNLMTLAHWQTLLESGKKIPAVGGSDYHRDSPFLFLGGPTTCVYAMSAGPSDILRAVREGHAYIIFSPEGPSLELTAGDAILGDSVPWPAVRHLQVVLDGLRGGDLVRLVTNKETVTLLQAPAGGSFRTAAAIDAPGFARVEVWRSFLPGLPLLPALISNPIYFDGQAGE